MIIQLLPEQITEYWDIIRFAALSVNPHINTNILKSKFASGLLASLLAGKHQVWVSLSESKEIKVVIVTEIHTDAGGIKRLFMSTVYGFEPSTEEEKESFMQMMLAMARNLDCASVMGMTINPMAMNAMKKMGMNEVMRVFEREV